MGGGNGAKSKTARERKNKEAAKKAKDSNSTPESRKSEMLVCFWCKAERMVTQDKDRAIHDTSKHPGQPSKWEPTKNKS